MRNPISMEPVAKAGTIPAVAGNGIRLYDADGNTYYDLSVCSTHPMRAST